MKNILDNYFYPKSICVAGASTKEKSIGYELLKSIKTYGYTGKIFPVNPKADNILGYKCFRQINEIFEKIELAIVVVPKQFAEQTIDELLKKDVKAIILVTAGFKEVGQKGAEAEEKLIRKVQEAGARIVGPNCMGVITTFENIRLNATFVAEQPKVGQTAFLSQSGALGAAVLNSLRETDIKFGHFISVGNKADISENDLIEYWQNDRNIKTITCYLESFVNGEKFLQPFINSRITKPVIILKAGRTSSGIKAASSHTGALGSSDKVVEAVLNQFGIIRAETVNELFNTAKGFENFQKPKGNRIAIVTNAGGPAILTVDSLEPNCLQLATLCEETKVELKKIVHPEGSVQNPVDLLPGGTAEQYKQVNEILLNDKNVDAVISIFVEPVMVSAFPVIESINSIESDKPVFQIVMPLPEFWEEYRQNSRYGKPLFKNPEDPAKVISNILFYSRRQKNRVYLAPKKSIVSNTEAEGFLSQASIKNLAEQYNIPLVKSYTKSNEDLQSGKNKFDYPLVLKGISSEVIHKSELDAVKLNIKNEAELIEAKNEILLSFSKNNVELDNFLLQSFIVPKHEILIGGYRDTSFGPMIMFGSGGKYVEVYKDTCLKSAFISDEDIEDILTKTKIGKILKGVRGENPVELTELKQLIKNSAQMMLDNKEIIEFDFNPVLISQDDKLFAVDIRIKLG